MRCLPPPPHTHTHRTARAAAREGRGAAWMRHSPGVHHPRRPRPPFTRRHPITHTPNPTRIPPQPPAPPPAAPRTLEVSRALARLEPREAQHRGRVALVLEHALALAGQDPARGGGRRGGECSAGRGGSRGRAPWRAGVCLVRRARRAWGWGAGASWGDGAGALAKDCSPAPPPRLMPAAHGAAGIVRWRRRGGGGATPLLLASRGCASQCVYTTPSRSQLCRRQRGAHPYLASPPSPSPPSPPKKKPAPPTPQPFPPPPPTCTSPWAATPPWRGPGGGGGLGVCVCVEGGGVSAPRAAGVWAAGREGRGRRMVSTSGLRAPPRASTIVRLAFFDARGGARGRRACRGAAAGRLRVPPPPPPPSPPPPRLGHVDAGQARALQVDAVRDLGGGGEGGGRGRGVGAGRGGAGRRRHSWRSPRARRRSGARRLPLRRTRVPTRRQPPNTHTRTRRNAVHTAARAHAEVAHNGDLRGGRRRGRVRGWCVCLDLRAAGLVLRARAARAARAAPARVAAPRARLARAPPRVVRRETFLTRGGGARKRRRCCAGNARRRPRPQPRPPPAARASLPAGPQALPLSRQPLAPPAPPAPPQLGGGCSPPPLSPPAPPSSRARRKTSSCPRPSGGGWGLGCGGGGGQGARVGAGDEC